ncbi:MAG: hypothetical protein LBT93_04180, partial [Treponema sp.]|nr:hypothetical protein [Treponema sp.]
MKGVIAGNPGLGYYFFMLEGEKRKRGRPPQKGPAEAAGGEKPGEPVKARRGRPSKKGALDPPANGGGALPAVEGARISRPLLVRGVKEGFYFVAGREGDRSFFRFRDAKGGKRLPDFRHYTGTAREVLRDFFARKTEQDRSFVFVFDKKAEDDFTLYNPDERLIEKALAAGLLRD